MSTGTVFGIVMAAAAWVAAAVAGWNFARARRTLAALHKQADALSRQSVRDSVILWKSAKILCTGEATALRLKGAEREAAGAEQCARHMDDMARSAQELLEAEGVRDVR